MPSIKPLHYLIYRGYSLSSIPNLLCWLRNCDLGNLASTLTSGRGTEVCIYIINWTTNHSVMQWSPPACTLYKMKAGSGLQLSTIPSRTRERREELELLPFATNICTIPKNRVKCNIRWQKMNSWQQPPPTWIVHPAVHSSNRWHVFLYAYI